MDYEFFLDEVGEPEAKFSAGSEAIGRWFTEELANHSSRIDDVLAIIVQCETRDIERREWVGAQFILTVSRDEVSVVGRALDIDDDELPENTNYYDQEHHAECGLEDFKQALLSWRLYVTS